MMRVVMAIDISGTRDDAPWPAKGQEVDVPEAEAEHLLAQGYAILPEPERTPAVEKAVAAPRGERRTRKA